MKKLVLTLIVTLAFSGSILAQHETHWPEFDDGPFSYVDYITAFLEVDGDKVERVLAPGEVLKVDTGNVVAFEPTETTLYSLVFL